MKALCARLFDRFTAWMRSVLAEDGGQSSLRLVMIQWHTAVAVVWIALCLWRRELVPIDGSILALLGGVTGAKLGQKAMEVKSNP